MTFPEEGPNAQQERQTTQHSKMADGRQTDRGAFAGSPPGCVSAGHLAASGDRPGELFDHPSLLRNPISPRRAPPFQPTIIAQADSNCAHSADLPHRLTRPGCLAVERSSQDVPPGRMSEAGERTGRVRRSRRQPAPNGRRRGRARPSSRARETGLGFDDPAQVVVPSRLMGYGPSTPWGP